MEKKLLVDRFRYIESTFLKIPIEQTRFYGYYYAYQQPKPVPRMAECLHFTTTKADIIEKTIKLLSSYKAISSLNGRTAKGVATSVLMQNNILVEATPGRPVVEPSIGRKYYLVIYFLDSVKKRDVHLVGLLHKLGWIINE